MTVGIGAPCLPSAPMAPIDPAEPARPEAAADAELLRRYGAGDRAAFDRLYDRHDRDRKSVV